MNVTEDIKKLKELPKEYLENLQENSTQQLLELIAMVVAVFMRKVNVPQDEIAEELEEETDHIRGLYDLIKANMDKTQGEILTLAKEEIEELD